MTLSILSGSTLEDTPGAPSRADSFFFNAEEDLSLSYNQWHSSRHQYSMPESEVVYERVFEPHPSSLAAGSSSTKKGGRVFVSRRPPCTKSAAAAFAAQWRAQNTPAPSASTTPMSTPSLSATRSSTSDSSSRSVSTLAGSTTTAGIKSAVSRLFRRRSSA